jgi:dimethylaniline monooxygenase (N-oxide forming)
MLGAVALLLILSGLYYFNFVYLCASILVIVVTHLGWRMMYQKKKRTSLYTTVSEADVVVKGHHAERKKVCVIGAGAGGLVAAKELLAEGHSVTCFEQYSSWGGVFYYSKEKGGVYDNTVLTISNYFMAYSDFPPPEGEAYKFWHHKEYYSYLESYVKHFKLLEKAQFHFNAQVTKVQQDEGSLKWKVTVSMATGSTSTYEFDALVVATGAHQIPAKPQLLSGVEFSDDTKAPANSILCVHSETYKLAEGDPRFEGKKVVCVGAGETGVDVAYEVSKVASKAFISMKRPPMVIPRNPWNLGFAADIHTARAMLYCNHAYIRWLHEFDQFIKYHAGGAFAQKLFKGAGGLGDPRMQKIADLARRSGGSVTDQFLTKNCNFIESLLNSKLIEKPLIKSIKGKTVQFVDGSSEEDVDTILFSTGYIVNFPFFSPSVELPEGLRSLYKHMFHPKLGSTVAFIGFARPSTGGVPATAEIQARYFSMMLTGSRKLPSDWKQRIPIEADMENKQFHLTTLKSVIFYGEYMEAMAAHVRCSPDLWYYFWRDPKFWLHLQYGPMLAAQFRLRGPHSAQTVAEKVLRSISPSTPIPFSVAQSVLAALSWVGGLIFSFRPPSW